jgi:hypothetical protein
MILNYRLFEPITISERETLRGQIMLMKSPCPNTREEYLNAVRIMEEVMRDGMENIWPHIKERVSQRVFEEFGSLYRDINDERFVEMVGAGVDVDVSEIPETFQQKMMESNGYRDGCVMQQVIFCIFSAILGVSKLIKRDCHGKSIPRNC